MMPTIQIRREHRLRIVVLVVIALICLYWMHQYLPWGTGRTGSRPKHRTLTVARKAVELRDNKFFLENKELRILSGAMHYFRIVPEYWEDRLRRLKAAGLNTVETYVPWNLHEEVRGTFNFDGILDIRRFITIADRLGILVIVRPGPYICSEWDFGGLPSWLLSDPQMKVRSTYKPFMDAASVYLKGLLNEIEDLQYQYGGPVIAMQIENEYGSFGEDKEYMVALKKAMTQSGVIETLFTSDNKHGLEKGALPDVFMTSNFKNTKHGEEMFEQIKKLQPGKPLMVMEFWSGWFDHWGENHHTMDTDEYKKAVDFILQKGSSINLYMFHGGTNFGFMNGANAPYTPTVTSYDYDAPLSEAGDPTEKFLASRTLFATYNTRNPTPQPVPTDHPKAQYGALKVDKKLAWEDLLKLVKPISSSNVVTMEMLDINNHGGQGYGFINYRKTGASGLKAGRKLTVGGVVRDRAQVVCDSQQVGVIDWKQSDVSMDIPQGIINLDIVVENLGRINYGEFNALNAQRKGLSGPLLLDNRALSDWEIYPLEFRPEFIDRCVESSAWKSVSTADVEGPALYRTTLHLQSQPQDTFLEMQSWVKGVVFVNSFNLGRYWEAGPQKTLYVPAPLLHQGDNQIVIFELHKPNTDITFTDKPKLG